MKRKKHIILVIIIILLVCFIVTIVIRNSDRDRIVLKDNVNIITEETELQPILVDNDKLTYDENPKFEDGDVIVAGIIDSAPTGFIRKVLSTSEVNGQYVIKTENAFLTDVFEEAHITATFELSDDGIEVIDFEEEEIESILANNHNTVDFLETIGIESVTALSTKKYGFVKNVDYTLAQNVTASGDAGFNVWLESIIEIENDNIKWSNALYTETGGEIALNCSDGVTKNFEKAIFDKDFKPIVFMAGEVPIVITNQVAFSFEGSVELQGSIETVIGLGAITKQGFTYNSKSKKIDTFTDKQYTSSGVDWNTDMSALGSFDCGVVGSVLTKLYDSTGAEFKVGLMNRDTAQVCVNPKAEDKSRQYVGKVDLELTPEFACEIVGTIPVIDKHLANKQIIKSSFKPFWENHWTSGDNWETEWQKLRPKDDWELLYDVIIGDAIVGEQEGQLYFRELYWSEEVNVREDQLGGVIGGYRISNESNVVYALVDIDKNGISELLIGDDKGANIDILAIFYYSKDERNASPIVSYNYSYTDEPYYWECYLCEYGMIYTNDNFGGFSYFAFDNGATFPFNNMLEDIDDVKIDTNTLGWKDLQKWNKIYPTYRTLE